VRSRRARARAVAATRTRRSGGVRAGRYFRCGWPSSTSVPHSC
jgi:hypothetical protein